MAKPLTERALALFGGLLFSGLIWASDTVAQETTKLALVIGNSSYDEGFKLGNPCTDAENVILELVLSGWDERNIFGDCDLTSDEMYREISDFADRYMDSEFPLGFVYIAGHGLQIDKTTYIFGVDADFDVDRAIERYRNNPNSRLFSGSITIGRELLGQIGDALGGTLLIVIDACRENPVDEALRQSIYQASLNNEPINMDFRKPAYRRSLPPSIKFFFSTEDGALAPDGVPGYGSPFNQEFVSMMRSFRNETINVVTSQVSDSIYTKTLGQPTPIKTQSIGELSALPPPEICFASCH